MTPNFSFLLNGSFTSLHFNSNKWACGPTSQCFFEFANLMFDREPFFSALWHVAHHLKSILLWVGLI